MYYSISLFSLLFEILTLQKIISIILSSCWININCMCSLVAYVNKVQKVEIDYTSLITHWPVFRKDDSTSVIPSFFFVFHFFYFIPSLCLNLKYPTKSSQQTFLIMHPAHSVLPFIFPLPLFSYFHFFLNFQQPKV